MKDIMMHKKLSLHQENLTIRNQNCSSTINQSTGCIITLKKKLINFDNYVDSMTTKMRCESIVQYESRNCVIIEKILL